MWQSENLGGILSFKKEENIEPPQKSWRGINIFNVTYRTANDQYKRMMEEAGVGQWAKVTHMRKVGCDFCSAQGLQDDQIKTISNHSKNDIFGKSYRSPLSIPVMTCLAGFVPDKEKYYVPRTKVNLPIGITIEDLSLILFPELTTWKREQDSDEGDKSEGARHYLYKIIPYFTMCIIQDGIYHWVQKFPQNPAVGLLL